MVVAGVVVVSGVVVVMTPCVITLAHLASTVITVAFAALKKTSGVTRVRAKNQLATNLCVCTAELLWGGNFEGAPTAAIVLKSYERLERK